MADKTTTLKTKTNDNVYPKVIGESRKDAFANSSTITHHFYDKTHKVGFQIANETNIKIQNSLQKPSGLTKTELVGVGTNGQENIEIGDNLTLANGKLSAATGSKSPTWLEYDETNGWNSGDIVEAIKSGGGLIMDDIDAVFRISNLMLGLPTELPVFGYTMEGKDSLLLFDVSAISPQLKVSPRIVELAKPTYSHFITMTNSTNNVILYLTIQNIDGTEFTADTLASYLADKKVLANGNLHGSVPTYIAGEGGVIKIYYMTPGDSNINPTPDSYSDLSSFNITDLVTPVE